MAAAFAFIPLALEGQWSGAAAVGVVLTGITIFIGSVYYILTTLFGWRRAYYIVVVSLMGFVMILSLVWLIGIPGTGPGFGPRDREPSWIPFLPTAKFAEDFKNDIATFPDGWDEPGKKYFGNSDTKKTGAIDSAGEIDTVKALLEPSLAGYFQKQGTGSADPADYSFRRQLSAADEAKLSPEDKAVPVGEIRFKNAGRGFLLFGVRIPATDKHPEITAFAMRDRGVVFLWALLFLISSVVLFAGHLWLLARDEIKQRARAAETATTVTTVRTGG